MKKRIIQITLITSIWLIFQSSAFAWKPVSHVYLAEQVINSIEETTENGEPVYTIPIYYVDYETGEEGDKIDDFKLSSELVEAIRENRDVFYAGVLGPDAYPDIVTGQTRIHADGDGTGTDEWLQYLWDEANASNDPQIKLFVRGFLNHAAGDMFMHTFVNHFAGGEFKAPDNAVRHMVIESYIGKRTPKFADNTLFNLTLPQNIKNFIYEKMIDARQSTDLRQRLLDNVSGKPLLNASLPLRFSEIRDWLDSEIETYDFVVDSYQTQYEEKLSEAQACGFTFNPICIPIYAEAAVILGQQQAYVLLNSAFHEYMKSWRDNIITGLQALPQFSHDVALKLSFNPNGIDRVALEELGTRYFNEHLSAMLGAPDFAGELRQNIIDVRELFFGDLEDLLAATEDAIINVLLHAAFGFGIEDAERYFKNPELQFDPIMNAGKNPFDTISYSRDPVPITLAAVNGLLRLENEDGFDNPNKTFDQNLFEPAYNTMVMTKLLLLEKAELQRLRNFLNCVGNNCNDVENAMLGFIRTIDGDNEWHNNNKLMTVGHCQVFRQIFKKQIGEYETEFEQVQGNCPEPQLAEVNLITPPSGEYASAQTISLFHADPDVEIYYTINEADKIYQPSNAPTDNRSQRYSNPFALPVPFAGDIRPIAVAIKAFKPNMKASETTLAEYTVTLQNNVPLLIIGENEPYITSVDIGLSQEDGAIVYYTLNGQTPDYTTDRYTAPLTLGIGVHNIKAIAYKFGSAQSPILNETVKVFDTNTSRPMTPGFTPEGSGDYTTAITFELNTQTENASIYYTIAKDGVPENPDANQPTNNATLYTAPITIDQLGNWFLRARTYSEDFVIPSEIAQINYELVAPLGNVLTPVITPPGGTFNNAVNVTITAETDVGGQSNNGVRIFYNTDGTTPVVLPAEQGNYSAPFSLNRNSQVKAKAYRQFFTNSQLADFKFTFEAAEPNFEPAAGQFVDLVQVDLNSDTFDAEIRYTIDGSEPTIDSTLFTTPINVSETTTISARAFKEGYFFSEVSNATYQLRPAVVPIFIKSPVDAEVNAGEDITFYALADGWPAADYEWRLNGIPISGENNSSITINAVSETNAGTYEVIATNTFGSANAKKAVLNIIEKIAPPIIIRQPSNSEVDLAGSIALSIGVDNTDGETSIVWYHNDLLLMAKNGEVLNITNAKTLNAGEYYAVASNTGGSVTSERVTVDILLPQAEPAELDLDEPEPPKEKSVEQNNKKSNGGGCTINPDAKPDLSSYLLLLGLIGFFITRRKINQSRLKK